MLDLLYLLTGDSRLRFSIDNLSKVCYNIIIAIGSYSVPPRRRRERTKSGKSLWKQRLFFLWFSSATLYQMDIYIDPTKCVPCKYRVQLNTIGIFRSKHDLPKINLIEKQGGEELPYLLFKNEKIHLSEITLDKLESMV